MKKILVPTDFSEQSDYALDFAMQIAENTDSVVLLLHIADLPVVADPMGTNLHAFLSPDTLQMMEDKIRKKLNEFISSKKSSVEITTHFEWGNPYSGIASNITDKDVDLVVMGSKGSSGAREIFIGSNAERVIRNSPVPVITIKEPVTLDAINKIVFGTDLSHKCNEVVNQLKGLQSLLKAELHIVRINTPVSFESDSETWPALRDFVDEFELNETHIHIWNDMNEDIGLIHFADYINADMIALGTHGKRGIEHFISGSIAEDIVNHAKRPIWTNVIKK